MGQHKQDSMFPGVTYNPKRAQAIEEREAQADLMARKRAAAREVEIPAVADPDRRARCERSLEAFCLTYFGALFYLAFCFVHREIIQHLEEAVLNGGRVAIAAPRGFGKSTLTLIAIVWAIVYGHSRYVVLICKNKNEAKERLKIIKAFFEDNAGALAEDFPEICAPVHALEGSSQRGARQTVGGERTRIDWGVEEITCPHVEGSPSSGSVVAAYGLDEAIRGLLRERDGELMRPDLVLGDDPQTDESARSELQTTNRILYLTKAIQPLAAPGKKLSIVLLVTVIEHGDLADQFTSEKQPSFRSIRTKAVLELPADLAPSKEYIHRRQDAMRRGDFTGRAAHAWYLRHRAEIEQDAAVTWPENYIANTVSEQAVEAMLDTEDTRWAREAVPLESILSEEISAYQRQLNFIADADSETVDGWDAWRCEMQNEPPEPENLTLLRLDAHTVMEQTDGLARGIVPLDAVAIVEGWDCGRYKIDWVVAAVLPGRRVRVVDYGEEFVDSPRGDIDHGSAEGKQMQRAIETAMSASLCHLRDEHHQTPYRKADGTEMPSQMIFVDSRYGTSVVRKFADESGNGVMAIMGMGTAKHQRAWSVPKSVDLAHDGAMYAREERGAYRYYLHTDKYKADVHAGFLLPADTPGSIALFDGDRSDTHRTFAQHITAERETELAPGVTRWEKTRGRKANHKFDCMVYCLAAITFVEYWIPEAGLYGVAPDADSEDTPPPVAEPVVRNVAPPVREARMVIESQELDL